MEQEQKTKKHVNYTRVSGEASDEYYIRALQLIGVEKRYLQPGYTAQNLAEELGINSRQLSTVISRHSDGNYNTLVNSYRLRAACRMLRSPRYRKYTAEEIGLMCGFASRQAFYLAFRRDMGTTPRAYRLQEQAATDEK